MSAAELREAWLAAADRLDAALNAWSAAYDADGTSDPALIEDIKAKRDAHAAAWAAYKAVR